MILRGDRCRCSACGEYFNSTGMFDAHRRGAYPDRRCLTVAEMYSKGYLPNQAGFWIRKAMARRTCTEILQEAIV